MGSLIVALRRSAGDATTSVVALILRAKVIASKLELPADLGWINEELEGYKDWDRIPQYRRVRSKIKVRNPIYGWQPVSFDDLELEESMTVQYMSEPLSVLVELTERVKNTNNGVIQRSLAPLETAYIHKQMSFPMEVLAFLDQSALTHVIEMVRARILNWTLELETSGARLDDDALTEQGDDSASPSSGDIHIGHIENFAGSVGGTVHGQTITQTNSASFNDRARDFIAGLDRQLDGLPYDETAEIRAAANLVTAEIDSENPDESRIKKALRAVGVGTLALGRYATQAAITAEIARLMTSH